MPHRSPSPLGGVDTSVDHHRIGDPVGVEAPTGAQRVSNLKRSNTTVVVKAPAPVVEVPDPVQDDPPEDDSVEETGDVTELAGPVSNKINDILDYVNGDPVKAQGAHYDEIQTEKPRKRLIAELEQILTADTED